MKINFDFLHVNFMCIMHHSILVYPVVVLVVAYPPDENILYTKDV